MKRLFYKSCIVFTLLTTISISAFSQLTIDGELRPRAEIRDGFKKLQASNSEVAGVITQRSRLTLGYKSEFVTTKISFQDVRVWGSEPLKQNVPSAAVHEAWAELKVIDSVKLKVGRQELNYGNERLLGAGNWLQQAISHDAAVLKFKYNTWTADIGASFNQTADNILSGTYYAPAIANYKWLSFLWVNKKINTLSLTGVAIADNYQKGVDTSYTRYTIGGIAEYPVNNFMPMAQYFVQSGKTATGQEISAYYFSADLAYKLDKLKPKIGIEYLSGNDNSNTGNKKLNAFNTLYGTGHKFNGSMEYFLASAATKNAGLVDLYLGAAYKINDKLSCKADYHYFTLQNNFYTNVTTKAKVDKYLGSEVDLSIKADFNKESGLEVGYSFLKAGSGLKSIQAINNSKLNSWVYVMLIVKPKFL